MSVGEGSIKRAAKTNTASADLKGEKKTAPVKKTAIAKTGTAKGTAKAPQGAGKPVESPAGQKNQPVRLTEEMPIYLL